MRAAAPKLSPALIAIFRAYLRRWYLPQRFAGLRLSGPAPVLPAGRPAIVYSNHPGWWDAVLFALLGGIFFPERAQYGPMDAAALARYRFFARIGAFPVELDRPRGAASFLRVAREILRDSQSLLWITPEGAFTDARTRPIKLRPGLAHLARLFPQATVVPLAIEYVFWDEPKPEALVRFGPPVRDGDFAGALEAAMDALAGAAVTRDRARFETLVEGGHGVAAPYDLWRRLRAGKAEPLA